MCLHVAMAHNVSGEEIVSLVGLVVNKMYVVGCVREKRLWKVCSRVSTQRCRPTISELAKPPPELVRRTTSLLNLCRSRCSIVVEIYECLKKKKLLVPPPEHLLLEEDGRSEPSTMTIPCCLDLLLV